MLRNRLIIGVAVLVLLGAIAGCGGELEQPPEAASTLERTVEETIAVSDQFAEETIAVLEQPAEEASPSLEQPPEAASPSLEQPPEAATTFSITGYVIVDAYRYDAVTGTYVHFYHDESSNLITTIGLDWIEDQLGDTPATDPAKWISLSTDATATDASWGQLGGVSDTEIIADGLERAVGAYTSTGVGAWEIEATFTASATHTNVQLTGLQWIVTVGSDGDLMAANTFTPVTLNSGDTLTITWQLSLS